MTGTARPPILLLLALAGGCAGFGGSDPVDPDSLPADPQWLRATTVPRILQEGRSDCGAAALAAVLASWNSPASPDEIRRACPESAAGIKAGDLRDFARRKGLKAFLVEGVAADLENELTKRRPVMVGLALVVGDTAVTHYEVVVGLHRGDRRVVTLDPAGGWRIWSWERFDEVWSPSRRLALVCFKPEE